MTVAIRPIEERHLAEVGAFLHRNLNRRISPEAWAGSLTHRWAIEQPNHGMQLRDGDALVGVFCAIYSDQQIGGRVERFCNPHSWCVLDAYRSASIQLVLALLKQRGYHYTMYTPNPKVAQVFLGLRFKLLDDRLLTFPNLPWPARGRAVSDPTRIEAELQGTALDEFRAHRDIPWLRFVAFGRDGDMQLAIWKPIRVKRQPCVWLMHLSDPSALERHGALLRSHWLLAHGMRLTRVEARFVTRPPALSIASVRGQPKLASSKTLADGQMRDVYSEMMALDL
ncbi:MAG: hypothetical protein JSR59_13705 [Proteobacteria bacterium]|nr:hypothetical protein [Pseudomonadota bacterium]